MQSLFLLAGKKKVYIFPLQEYMCILMGYIERCHSQVSQWGAFGMASHRPPAV